MSNANIDTAGLIWGCLWRAVLYGVLLGTAFGGFYGAAFGTLIFPLVGTMIGLVLGAPSGAVVGLAGEYADLWLLENTLTVEHAGEPLSAYEVAYHAAGGSNGAGRLLEVNKPTLFETSHASRQPRLFGLDSLSEGGWLKAVTLADSAARRTRPGSLQQALFPYHEAWG